MFEESICSVKSGCQLLMDIGEKVCMHFKSIEHKLVVNNTYTNLTFSIESVHYWHTRI